jgi:hypothetical protein
MKNKTPKNVLLAAVLLCGTVFTSRAQITIFSDNLNSQPLGPAPGYFYGAAANVSHSYVAGVGVGGSEAGVLQTDFTATPNYGGAAFQYQNTVASGNTSANLSDYTLSFDAEVNAANGGFQLDVQSFAGPGITGISGEGIISPNIQLGTANVFQHLSYNLGQLLLSPGGNPNLPVGTAPDWQIAFIIGPQPSGPWGLPSTGDQLIIDNIQLTMVPEPASLTVCAMGGLAAFAFLRRRKS